MGCSRLALKRKPGRAELVGAGISHRGATRAVWVEGVAMIQWVRQQKFCRKLLGIYVREQEW